MKTTTLRLDSPPFLEAAHRLYRRRGFREIAPYPESFAPPQYLQHWLHMELELQQQGGKRLLGRNVSPAP